MTGSHPGASSGDGEEERVYTAAELEAGRKVMRFFVYFLYVAMVLDVLIMAFVCVRVPLTTTLPYHGFGVHAGRIPILAMVMPIIIHGSLLRTAKKPEAIKMSNGEKWFTLVSTTLLICAILFGQLVFSVLFVESGS